MNLMKKTYLLLFTLFFIIVISVSAWLALQTIKNESLNNIRNSLQTVTKTSYEALHIWISLRKKSLIEIVQDEAIISLTKKMLTIQKKGGDFISSAELQSLRQIMRHKMNIHQDIGFFVIAPNKVNIASSRDNNINQQNIIYINRRALLSRIFSGETLFVPPIQSDVPLLSSNGKYIANVPTTFIGSPVKTKDGDVIAVLTLRLDPSSDFTRVTQLGRIGDSGETYAFDSKGILITSSRFDHQLQKIGLVDVRGQGMLTIRITDPGGNMLTGYKPKMNNSDLPLTLMAKNAVSGKSGFNVDGYRDYRGVPVFGSWIWDKDLGFGLTTEIDVEEALIPYYKTRLVVLLVVLVVVILSVGSFLLWFTMERKSESSQKLALVKLELEVEERTKELRELSYKDGLTGVANRRMFDQTLQKEWQRGQREQQALALLMIDIDFFKSYNDLYGHQQGDACLINVANTLNNQIRRSSDLFARYGGEEFVVLLPNTSLEEARTIAKSYCLKIIEADIVHDKTEIEGLSLVSISVGVSSIVPSVFIDKAQLITDADEKLYLAKTKGRNRVE